MPFGVVSRIGRGMDVLDGGGYRRRERGSFGGKFLACHCNQWGLCCVAVRERRTLPKLLWEDLFRFVANLLYNLLYNKFTTDRTKGE